MYKYKLKDELIKDKQHYEFMKEQYSKGAGHWIKDSIVKDADYNLKLINEQLERYKK